jgi:hypothetical protein
VEHGVFLSREAGITTVYQPEERMSKLVG